jgi:hypothetical protein
MPVTRWRISRGMCTAVGGELRFIAELVQGVQAGLGAVREADRDGPVEGHDRRRPVLNQQVIQPGEPALPAMVIACAAALP